MGRVLLTSNMKRYGKNVLLLSLSKLERRAFASLSFFSVSVAIKFLSCLQRSSET